MFGVFQSDEQKVKLVVHVDNILLVGTENSLRMVQKRLKEVHEMGPERHHAQEVKNWGRHWLLD